MLEALQHIDAPLQALLAGIFTWLVTALGAAMVFVRRELPAGLLDAMLGFAAGVMIAASFWSLLLPAIETAQAQNVPAWFPAMVGFLAGAAFLRLADRLLPHVHIGLPRAAAEGPPTRWKKTTLLVLAITLHNIPEGLAVGVAFGAASIDGDAGKLVSAIALAIGIGLQNFPEGVAVAMPLRREGVSAWKSFSAGQLSAIVEPVAAILGAIAVQVVTVLLPYALAFAAGAMIFVVVEELIPEAQQGGRTDMATLATVIGFTVMMVLDVALG